MAKIQTFGSFTVVISDKKLSPGGDAIRINTSIKGVCSIPESKKYVQDWNKAISYAERRGNDYLNSSFQNGQERARTEIQNKLDGLRK